MTEEKLTALGSPTPSGSPHRAAPGAGWLARVFRPGHKGLPPGAALALQREPLATHVEPGRMAETPRSGAARALAHASGLTAKSRSGPLLTALAVALGLALLASVYFFYRHQTAGDGAAASGLNLVAPDEKLTQLLQLGEQARAQGQYDAAREYYRQAAQFTPDNTTLLTTLAWLNRTTGHVEESLQTYSRLVELDPKNLEARMQRAYIYFERGAWREADQEFRQIIRLAPHSEQANAALSALETASAGRDPQYQAARRDRRRPNFGPNLPYADSPVGLIPLPQLLASAAPLPLPSGGGSSDERESAQALAESAKSKGLRLAKVGEYQTAILEFEKAARLTPEDKDIYYHLASAQMGAKLPALAHENYKKCEGGTYGGTCRDGAKKTSKAAREAARKEQPQKSGE
jgi:tetratricopeptide (TPR) repeat protein